MSRVLLLPIFLLLYFLSSSSLFGIEKIKGVSFVASDQPIDKTDVTPIVELSANWVTLMPYGFIGKEGVVMYNSKWQWWGEKEEGLRRTIELCEEAGLKIMVKPQIWMRDAYTGDFKLNSIDQWKRFEQSYEQFILDFLTVSEDLKVDLFCIGTEWREFIRARPEFWKQLILKIRKKFSGELIYAANWDDYQFVPFWDQLDYVGVNGYFPISISKRPSYKELVKGWNYRADELAQFSKRTNLPIVFTEIGYRSMEGATISPWEHNNANQYSAELQVNAYRSLFDVLWNKEWFAGMFIWKWYHNHSQQGGKGNIDFTPQNKPAIEIIQTYYSDQK